MAVINFIPFVIILTTLLSIIRSGQAFRSGLSTCGSISLTNLQLFPFGKSSNKAASNPKSGAAPKSAPRSAPKSDVAFGSSKPAAKSKTDANEKQSADMLQQARRVTRWIMFPGIFGNWDATEERMKPTIRITRTLSAREKAALRDRNPEMY